MVAAAIALAVLALIVLAIAGRIGEGTWVTKLLLGVDIFASTIIWGGFGITISSRCGAALRSAHGPWAWRMLGEGLNRLSAGHCESAISHDEARGLAVAAWVAALPARPSPSAPCGRQRTEGRV